MSDKHPPYWFMHEYCDEQGRSRVHKVTAETEQEARRLHRQACEFLWVTQHVRPSVSPLFTTGQYGQRSLIPSHYQGQPYRTETVPVPCPDDVKASLRNLRMGDEAALH